MPNKIFIVDEDTTGDSIQFVVRDTFPQTIPGLLAGDYTVINTAEQGEVTVTAAAGATTLLQEGTPTSYTGPTLTGTLPAAVGGYRTIAAADPAPISCPLSLSDTGYLIMRVRRASFSGIIAMFSINNGAYGSPPWFQVGVNGYTNNWMTTVQNSDYTLANDNVGINGSWQTVEAWFDATNLYISVNGGTPVTVARVGTGGITPTTLHMFRDEGSGGTTVDMAGWRIYAGAPTAGELPAIRAWADGLASN